jgi:hypothetical protein
VEYFVRVMFAVELIDAGTCKVGHDEVSVMGRIYKEVR